MNYSSWLYGALGNIDNYGIRKLKSLRRNLMSEENAPRSIISKRQYF